MSATVIISTLCLCLYVLCLLEGLCVVPTPSSKCKWPRFCQHFFSPTVPKLVSQKKKMLFVCVIRACGPLFASSRVTALIADSLASTESPSPTHFPAAAAPEAGYIQLQGSYWGPHCPINILSVLKPRALSKLIVSELTASLQKGLNACSLIIWILVNWINYWIETVLLKMTKTQGQGEQRGINIVSVCSRAVKWHKCARAHTRALKFRYALLVYRHVSLSSPKSVFLFRAHTSTHTQAVCDKSQKNERQARCKLPCAPLR